jgi:hypothetical protein
MGKTRNCRILLVQTLRAAQQIMLFVCFYVSSTDFAGANAKSGTTNNVVRMFLRLSSTDFG